MTHYQELTLLKQIEVPTYFIWTKLYTQLHLALAELQDANGKVAVGVSFPEYRYEENKGGYLGSKLRVFASKEATLQELNLTHWLARLTDYVRLTSIREVSVGRITGYANYSRVHIKGSAEKLAKRYAKRNGISLDEAVKRYNNRSSNSNLPYIRLKSLSTQQPFHLFIAKNISNELVQENFGLYGLDSLSTVPEFPSFNPSF